MDEKSYEHDPDLSRQSTVGEVLFFDAVSPGMKGLEAVIRELAHSRVPVLLIGERGTGKRTIANRIHRSASHPGEFRILSCSTVSPVAFTKDLFGDGTTFYLEEIGDLPAECQKRLMGRLSQTAGDGVADVRVIAGSSRDLEPEARNRTFREDLYYRLSGVCLRIPPLRQRKEDIPHLVNFFLARYAKVFRRPMPSLSGQTQQLFFDYVWPGNLRELESVVRAIVAVGDESIAMEGFRSLLIRSDASNGEKISLKEAARAASRVAEKELILKVLARTRWNRRRAAQELQISYKALLYKLKQIGFEEFETS
jgi:two-component system response regulator AtoC